MFTYSPVCLCPVVPDDVGGAGDRVHAADGEGNVLHFFEVADVALDSLAREAVLDDGGVVVDRLDDVWTAVLQFESSSAFDVNKLRPCQAVNGEVFLDSASIC